MPREGAWDGSPQLPVAVGTRPGAPVRPSPGRRRCSARASWSRSASLAASAYGLLADEPYRSLPEATVFAARGQDVVSLLVAVALVVLALPARLTPTRFLAWLGLLAYVVYSYAIYLIGVPMNRVFLVYVLIESVAGAALLAGLWRLAAMRWPTTASRRLRRGTGWMLVVVAVLFAGLWLSTLLPFAFGGSPPDPEGVGGTPYPVFVLDLVVVLPAIAAVGVLLLRSAPARTAAGRGGAHQDPDVVRRAVGRTGVRAGHRRPRPPRTGRRSEPAAAGRERLARHPLVAHPGRGEVMNTLVVYESMWGNTRAVAEAVAAPLGDDVTLVEVNDAPDELPADLDLLVVGGPTHAFSMSRASTRRDAVAKGASTGHVERGIREWLDEVVAPDTRRRGDLRHPRRLGPPPSRLGGQGRGQGGAPPPPRTARRLGELLRRRHGRTAVRTASSTGPAPGASRWPRAPGTSHT